MSGDVVKIKICGVTRPEDARQAVELGADLLGLNFYPPSPRSVDPALAAEIAAEVAGAARLVGVFVNHDPLDVERLVTTLGLDLLQFHGEESAEQIAPFAAQAIKVLRPPADLDPEALERLLDGWGDCWGFLFDTPHHRLYGGTGEAWAYGRLRRLVADCGRPVLVAGGVGPGNVRRLLAELPGLYAIDVCSGVEAAPGRKDRSLLEQLFAEVCNGQT